MKRGCAVRKPEYLVEGGGAVDRLFFVHLAHLRPQCVDERVWVALAADGQGALRRGQQRIRDENRGAGFISKIVVTRISNHAYDRDVRRWHSLASVRWRIRVLRARSA